mgnify:CR=1 FL=1
MNRVAPARNASKARPPESDAVVRLRKILDLEQKRGCDDGAVMGGLDQFLRIAAEDSQVSALIEAAPKLAQGYGGASVAARKQWLQLVLTARTPEAKPKGAPAAKAAPAARPTK